MRLKQYSRLMTSSLIIMILSLLSSADIFAAQSPGTFDHQHLLLTKVLSRHVSNGRVNYQSLKKNPAELDEYLQKLADIDPDDFKKWSREQQLALWINAYNSFTIKVILDHYPIQHS